MAAPINQYYQPLCTHNEKNQTVLPFTVQENIKIKGKPGKV